MNIKYFSPDSRINSWVKRYFILDHNDLLKRKESPLSLSPLTSNCWFFIITDQSGLNGVDSFCHFFEIDNFSEKIPKCDFTYSSKFRLLCIQFDLGVPIKKVFGEHYKTIVEIIKLKWNFEKPENESIELLDSLLSNFTIETNNKQKLTTQIMHYLKEHPSIKINELSHAFYLCPRQIHRIFQEQTGYSLKSCQKYLRIIKSLYLTLHSNGNNLNNVIYSMGYYDHNHFLKDFKIFYGATPSHLIKRKSFYSTELFFDAVI